MGRHQANEIKQCRRIATRYDKLAANYLAFAKLASIRIWLRANESTPQLFQVTAADWRGYGSAVGRLGPSAMFAFAPL